MMSEESNNQTKVGTESESNLESEQSESSSEDERLKTLKPVRKRKVMPRSCKKNGQWSLPSVQASNQERPTKRPTRRPSFCESMGESVMNSPQLPVRCGNKEGMLDMEKFSSSEPCILSEGEWFTAPQFEKFGGKGRYKKWKTSISYSNVNLQTLIEEGFLSSPSFKQRRTQDEEPRCSRARLSSSKRPRPATNGHTNDVIISVSSSDLESSEEEDEDDDVHADLAQFLGDSFTVSCSAGIGTLHKKRFAKGKRGKCIRTEHSWMTPEQFLNEYMIEGNWRRDIISHGKPLGILIQHGVLEPDAANCPCPTCRGENERDQDNDDECFVCRSEGNLVCCDKCPRAFHYQCHDPPLQDSTLSDQWICFLCTQKKSKPSR